jgi:hypothetical protein
MEGNIIQDILSLNGIAGIRHIFDFLPIEIPKNPSNDNVDLINHGNLLD